VFLEHYVERKENNSFFSLFEILLFTEQDFLFLPS
jgi:hypothetical protein